MAAVMLLGLIAGFIPTTAHAAKSSELKAQLDALKADKKEIDAKIKGIKADIKENNKKLKKLFTSCLFFLDKTDGGVIF